MNKTIYTLALVLATLSGFAASTVTLSQFPVAPFLGDWLDNTNAAGVSTNFLAQTNQSSARLAIGAISATDATNIAQSVTSAGVTASNVVGVLSVSNLPSSTAFVNSNNAWTSTQNFPQAVITNLNSVNMTVGSAALVSGTASIWINNSTMTGANGIYAQVSSTIWTNSLTHWSIVTNGMNCSLLNTYLQTTWTSSSLVNPVWTIGASGTGTAPGSSPVATLTGQVQLLGTVAATNLQASGSFNGSFTGSGAIATATNSPNGTPLDLVVTNAQASDTGAVGKSGQQILIPSAAFFTNLAVNVSTNYSSAVTNNFLAQLSTGNAAAMTNLNPAALSNRIGAAWLPNGNWSAYLAQTFATNTYTAFPAQAALPDNSAVYRAFYVSTNHIGTSSIFMDMTTNAGLSWSSPWLVVSNENMGSRNIQFGISRTGRFILWYGLADPSATTWTNAVCLTSDNKGASWTVRASLGPVPPMTYISPSGGDIAQDTRGRIHAPMYEGITSYTTYAMDAISDNDGVTWVTNVIVASTNGDVEPLLTTYGDEVFCITRQIGYRGQPTKHLWWSTNRGDSFIDLGSITGTTTNTLTSANAQPFVLQSAAGPYLGMVWGQRSTSNLLCSLAPVAQVMTNPGLLWSNSWQVATIGGSGGYPSLVSLPPSGALLVGYYYSDSSTNAWLKETVVPMTPPSAGYFLDAGAGLSGVRYVTNDFSTVSLTVRSNTWSLAVATNGMGVGDARFASSNGVPVMLWWRSTGVVISNLVNSASP